MKLSLSYYTCVDCPVLQIDINFNKLPKLPKTLISVFIFTIVQFASSPFTPASWPEVLI